MTSNADRKARIRAYRAAQPGLTYTAAQRRFDAAELTAALNALPPGPLNTLAALLAAIDDDDALQAAILLTRYLGPDPVAERLAQETAAAYAAMTNLSVTTSAHQRQALAEAFDAAQDAEDDYRLGHDPYDDERGILRAAAAGLRFAAAAHDSARLAGAVADVLDTLRFDFTADAIRSGGRHHLGPIPTTSAGTAAAEGALAAVRALAEAAVVPFAGDEQWSKCIRLLEEARDLARAASRT